MKKLFFALVLCLLFLNVAATVCAEQTGLKQYQMLAWQPVKNAGKYEVTVERKGPGGWEPAVSQQTPSTNLELLLLPGDYRVSVRTFTIFGKKAAASEWIRFTILDETEPYLFDTGFHKDNSMRDMPVFRPGYPDNSASAAATFTVKGKNIFFPETSFSFVPVNTASAASSRFPTYLTARKTVQLTVEQRDREKNSVTVSYDPYALYSGLYMFEVCNPGGKKTESPVLILAGRSPAIREDSFAFDRRYNVHTISIDRSKAAELSITGSNFQTDTRVSLIPAADGIPYPFASAKKRSTVDVTVQGSSSAVPSGDQVLKLIPNQRNIETGYYLLTAETPGLQRTSVLLLVNVTASGEEEPAITKIRAKHDRKTAITTLTLYGSSLINIADALLVSPCSNDTGINRRLPLKVLAEDKNGKHVLLSTTGAGLPDAGTWALFTETADASFIQYVTVGKNHGVSLREMDDDEIEATFFRPEELPAFTDLVVPDASTGPVPFLLSGQEWTGKCSRYFRYSVEERSGTVCLMLYPDMNHYARWTASVTNITAHAAGILRSGDVIRFKVTAQSYPQYWVVQLVTANDKKQAVYVESELGSERFRKKMAGYWQYDIPYTEFRKTGIRRRTGVIPAERICGLVYKNTGEKSYSITSPSDTKNRKPKDTCLEVYDIEIYKKNVSAGNKK